MPPLAAGGGGGTAGFAAALLLGGTIPERTGRAVDRDYTRNGKIEFAGAAHAALRLTDWPSSAVAEEMVCSRRTLTRVPSGNMT
jgi:hypothetical protein